MSGGQEGVCESRVAEVICLAQIPEVQAKSIAWIFRDCHSNFDIFISIERALLSTHSILHPLSQHRHRAPLIRPLSPITVVVDNHKRRHLNRAHQYPKLAITISITSVSPIPPQDENLQHRLHVPVQLGRSQHSQLAQIWHLEPKITACPRGRHDIAPRRPANRHPTHRAPDNMPSKRAAMGARDSRR